MGHTTVTTPNLKVISHPDARMLAYLCAKFEHFSFIRSRDMVRAHQNLNGPQLI